MTSPDGERAIATVDLTALRHNLGVVKRLAGESRVLAVVKADGYGHGLEQVAPALAATDGFAVATLREALAIRRLGLAHRVVLLEGVLSPAQLSAARQHRIDVVVHHAEQVALLQAAERQGAQINVWLKFDTGMHRLGFPPADVPALLDALADMPHVASPPRLMSHLASADVPGNAHTQSQIERFRKTVATHPGERSLANSAGLIAWPETREDWVRVGLLLYGVSPIAGQTAGELDLRPAMRFTTRLLAVNDCAAGEPVGYGGAFRAPETMAVGVAAVGYGDGYPRAATAATPVMVAGRECALAGRVSMDMIGIDLRGYPDARVGDEVVLWGAELPVERLVDSIQAIPWEMLCGVTRRVEFRYVGD